MADGVGYCTRIGESTTAGDAASAIRGGSDLGRLLAVEFARRSRVATPASLGAVGSLAAEVVGARAGRLFVADYGLRRAQELLSDGRAGECVELEGTVAGRAFATCEPVAVGVAPVVVWACLSDGSERIGLLELTFERIPAAFEESFTALSDVLHALTLLIVSARRYSDVWLRARRVQPLSEAAEAQWDLLPPLSHETPEVAVSGIVEPAYSIGGDSFDYAVNPGLLEFAFVDATGHGLPAVLMASAAILGLRNSRREHRSLAEAYREADQRIATQFGDCFYVTAQLGSLDLADGTLTWLNAGHVLPLLVRNDSFVGELSCRPSLPIGLGGDVAEVAVEPLQSGDRVLFYSDGVSESRAKDGSAFGTDRLADFLVRATIDRVSVAETVRRLSANVVSFVGANLTDDATLFLVEYRRDR